MSSMARQMAARPAGAAAARARPPRVSSVPAFGGWEVDGKAAPDYSRDFNKVRAARMRRRTKALSWSSFIGDAAAVDAVETQAAAPGCGGGGEVEEKRQQQWSSAATSDGDDDDDDRERRLQNRHRHRRLRSDDDIDDDDRRQPIMPGRPAPKGRNKFKGYLFGCVGGQW